MIENMNKSENSSNDWHLLRLRQLSGLQFLGPCSVNFLYALKKAHESVESTGSTEPAPVRAWEKKTSGEKNVFAFVLLERL